MFGGHDTRVTVFEAYRGARGTGRAVFAAAEGRKPRSVGVVVPGRSHAGRGLARLPIAGGDLGMRNGYFRLLDEPRETVVASPGARVRVGRMSVLSRVRRWLVGPNLRPGVVCWKIIWENIRLRICDVNRHT